MDDGVSQVLPALVDQPFCRVVLFRHVAVAIGVAVGVQPIERGRERVVKLPEKAQVAGPFVVLARQPEEEGCGVDAAVVRRVRKLTRLRHLAAAELMQDLAWLLVSPGVRPAPLPASQDAKALLSRL